MATKTARNNTPANEKVSAMAIAKDIYGRINAEGYKPTEKSTRQEFLRLVQSEAGLTPSGASTYWQNLQNEARGEPLYKYAQRRQSASRDTNARPTAQAPQTASVQGVEVHADAGVLAAAQALVQAEQQLREAIKAAV